MNEKILTIIVPTYNRKTTLKRGLEAIIPQVYKYKEKVALYVSDNCSDDGTDGYIQALHMKYPNLLNSKRQVENMGSEFNFSDAVRSAKTKYVVLFSDDDIMLPNFVETILAQLEAHPDVGLINYNALSVSSRGRYYGVRDTLSNFGVSKYYPQSDEFIKEHTHFPSLVSSNVFDRQAFIDQIEKVDVESYPGYGWFAILLFSVLHKPVMYIDYPLFLCGAPDVNRWEDRGVEYTILGLSRLFCDFDKQCAGVYNAWTEVFEKGWLGPSVLELALKYQPLYRDRFPILKIYVSPEYAKALRVRLFHSRRWILWSNRFLRIKRFLVGWLRFDKLVEL